MRAHYIKKGVLKKTSGQYSLGGCIPMHCYVSNSINNTSLFNIAENGTKVIMWQNWVGLVPGTASAPD